MSFFDKNNLIERHRFNPPKFYFDGETARLIDEISVQVADRYDDEIFQKIIGIAKEKGLGEITILNKQEIAAVLSKSIPKKPKEDSFPWAICPSCGGSVYLEKVQDHIQVGETTYCEHCGQSLDWRDGE